MTGAPAKAIFTGASGNGLIADVFGEKGPAVLLLHGGGQTRHAWRRTAERLAQAGSTAYALDQRGHGDSDWVPDGAYTFTDFAADAAAVADALAARSGERPAVVGASLGGIASLLAAGEAERSGRGSLFSVLVLVDITPRVDASGVEKIHGFMRAHGEGFRSIAEAAEAVATYLPHRRRPPSQQGLKKNLRLHPDGRWRWHWDPRFIDGPRGVASNRQGLEEALIAAARRIAIPALLVRGGASELVQEAHAREFLELVPHADYVDVGDRRRQQRKFFGGRHRISRARRHPREGFVSKLSKLSYLEWSAESSLPRLRGAPGTQDLSQSRAPTAWKRSLRYSGLAGVNAAAYLC
jgi:pimeloyl-ACP methyl ester carboxylesterase